MLVIEGEKDDGKRRPRSFYRNLGKIQMTLFNCVFLI